MVGDIAPALIVVIWCSLEIQYTEGFELCELRYVVIWCSLEIQYTKNTSTRSRPLLWFDVLWRFSTLKNTSTRSRPLLWFDVLWRFSTLIAALLISTACCDLMFFGDSVHFQKMRRFPPSCCDLMFFGDSVHSRRVRNRHGWLWFDVLWRFSTLHRRDSRPGSWLWFDVLWRFSTLIALRTPEIAMLWFDVLWRFSTLASCVAMLMRSCDLMFFGDSVHSSAGRRDSPQVVIWCSLEIQYTATGSGGVGNELWFDVLWRFSTLIGSTPWLLHSCDLMFFGDSVHFASPWRKCVFVVIWCSLEIQYTNRRSEHQGPGVVIWCSLEIQYTAIFANCIPSDVVIWCSLEIQYTATSMIHGITALWFDVLWRFSTLQRRAGYSSQAVVIWCSLEIQYTRMPFALPWSWVVIWCSLEIQYTANAEQDIFT